MRTSAKVTIFGGVLFVNSVLSAIICTLIGIVNAFSSVSVSATSSAQELSEYIGNALTSMAIGLPIGILGLCIFIVGLIVFFVRKPRTNIIQ